MKAILKKPGHEPELTDVGDSQEEIMAAIGGPCDCVPALFGAMVICRRDSSSLEYNCHFMSQHFRGNLMVVGRGLGNKPVDVPEHLRRILLLPLKGGKR